MSTELDAPIFEPEAWRLTAHEAELAERARRLGQEKFADRAEKWDREAIFPTDNYRDMHEAGLLGICIPKDNGGEGAGLRAYCISAAEIGRYCGATALTWNMHICSTLWTGSLADDLEVTDEQRKQHAETDSRPEAERSVDADAFDDLCGLTTHRRSKW